MILTMTEDHLHPATTIEVMIVMMILMDLPGTETSVITSPVTVTTESPGTGITRTGTVRVTGTATSATTREEQGRAAATATPLTRGMAGAAAGVGDLRSTSTGNPGTTTSMRGTDTTIEGMKDHLPLLTIQAGGLLVLGEPLVLHPLGGSTNKQNQRGSFLNFILLTVEGVHFFFMFTLSEHLILSFCCDFQEVS